MFLSLSLSLSLSLYLSISLSLYLSISLSLSLYLSISVSPSLSLSLYLSISLSLYLSIFSFARVMVSLYLSFSLSHLSIFLSFSIYLSSVSYRCMYIYLHTMSHCCFARLSAAWPAPSRTGPRSRTRPQRALLPQAGSEAMLRGVADEAFTRSWVRNIDPVTIVSPRPGRLTIENHHME